MDRVAGRAQLGDRPPSVTKHRPDLDVAPSRAVDREMRRPDAEERLALAIRHVLELELDRAAVHDRPEVDGREAGLLQQLASGAVFCGLAGIEATTRCEPPAPAFTVCGVASMKQQHRAVSVEDEHAPGGPVADGRNGPTLALPRARLRTHERAVHASADAPRTAALSRCDGALRRAVEPLDDARDAGRT